MSVSSARDLAVEAAHQWVVACGTLDLNFWDQRYRGPHPSTLEIADWRRHVAGCGIDAEIVKQGFPNVVLTNSDSAICASDRTWSIAVSNYEKCLCANRFGFMIRVSSRSVSEMFAQVWVHRANDPERMMTR